MNLFKLHTLKQKLWAIVGTSFVARVIMFFALPSTPSSLAPDEKTYAFLAKWVGESQPVSQFPGYGESLFLSGRALIVPASFLYRSGVDELDAIRLVASFYGFCALLVLVFMILKLYAQFIKGSALKAQNETLIATVVLVFAFLPSHFIWSILGLRESSTEFWLITAIITFFKIFHLEKKMKILSLLTLVGSIVLVFSSRPQVAWVLTLTFIIYLAFHLRETYTYTLIPVVLAAAVLGGSVNLGSANLSLGNLLNPLVNAGEIIDYKQQVNQLGASSGFSPPSCPRETASLGPSPQPKFDTYFCIAWRAPYMLSTFLFRPIIGLDVTSTSSLAAAIENIFWLALLVVIIILMLRKRSISFLAPLLPSLIFFVLYLLGASAYQGNMGTGFRHKSLILWVVLLVIFALAWRKPVEPVEITRSNSQESAV
jgi:hypothetical protein